MCKKIFFSLFLASIVVLSGCAKEKAPGFPGALKGVRGEVRLLYKSDNGRQHSHGGRHHGTESNGQAIFKLAQV